MPNKLVAVQVTTDDDAAPETLMLKCDKTWSSPPGGWMSMQSGKWEQISVAGVALQSDTGAAYLFMAGLVFDTTVQGSAGKLRDSAVREVGGWKVVGTS